jgi:hypothetical protein
MPLTVENINLIATTITDMVGGTWGLIALMGGIQLAFYSIYKLVNLVSGRYYNN